MGVSRLVDQGTNDSVAKVQEMVLGKIALARELTVARAGKLQPNIVRLRVQLDAGDDRNQVAADAAKEAVDVAETDAGEKKRTYIVALWGEPPSNDLRPALLVSTSIRVGEDDDNDGSTTRASAKIITELGERTYRALDQQLAMVERLLPMASQTDQLGAATVKADGDTRIRLTELAIGREERKELLELAVIFMPVWKGIGDSISDWVRAAAEAKRAEAQRTKEG
jgi:hypothetical protein